MDNSTPNPKPNTSTPLVVTPSPPQVSQEIDQGLGQLIRLVGNWHSKDGENSFCVMPLPQDKTSTGFILKNFAYNEGLTFARIPGTAPNRGGDYTQSANTLFYEQRVYFATTTEGGHTVPPKFQNMLVHAENGSWLFLESVPQYPGAFRKSGSPPISTKFPPQPTATNISKQMSVPHGNSILATGTVSPEAIKGQTPLPTLKGAPKIPGLSAIPTYMSKPYGADAYGKPNIVDGVETNLNINPNYKLVEYLEANTVTEYVHFDVAAAPDRITNISFETKHADVVGYKTEVWILNPNSQHPVLMYYQNITMDLSLHVGGEVKVVRFPHILVNVVKPVE